MINETERVIAAWEKIEQWYTQHASNLTLPEGASDADIQALETHLDLQFPEPFKASLRRHNGSENERWPKVRLLSLKGIQDESKVWNSIKFDEEVTVEDGTLEETWWSKKWVPIDADGGGNGSCLDLGPGPNGKVGQIIFMDHELGAELMYPDYAAYLETIATDLEANKYVVTEAGNIVDKKEFEEEQ